jgi:flagellar motor switch protein FliN/FliY
MTISQDDIDALLSSAGDLADSIEQPVQDPAPAAAPSPPPPPPEEPKPRAPESSPELARILEMQVPIIVTLAERNLALTSVLSWTAGSIIEFDLPADSELQLVIANKPIGLGHAVKVGENFGLRVTQTGDVSERIQAMGGG